MIIARNIFLAVAVYSAVISAPTIGLISLATAGLFHLVNKQVKE